MLSNVLLAAAVVVILLLQWKQLRQGHKSNRWAILLVLSGSLAIHLYTTAVPDGAHPTIWLHKLFDLIDPID